MIPLLFLVLGLAALTAGVLVLRSFGPRYRVGRLLTTTPRVSIAEALALVDGPRRYVAVRGRIDAEDEFEDAARRPLVFRRTRLERRSGRAWLPIDDRREQVDFEVREGLDSIGVDHAALDAGLVVVVRESVGTAGEIPDRVPADLPADTPVRVRIEQLSSVEHAIVLGVPARDPRGHPWLTAGLGRPLVLTTLEPPEAVRILAEGRTRRPLVAAVALALGLVLTTVGFAWGVIESLT